MKTIYWILGIILSPILLVMGIVFFIIAAVIIIAIAILFGLLAFVIYLNKKFKSMIYKIKNTSQKTTEKEKQEKHNWKGQEIVIEQIEEHEEVKHDKI